MTKNILFAHCFGQDETLFLFVFHFQTSDSIIGSSLVISGEIGGFQREESQDVIRDIDWSTRNVMLGYDVAGISPILLLT